MSAHRLVVGDSGSLELGGHLLLYFYDAGDCDRIAWPLRPGFARKLESALYDFVNTEELLKDGDTVELPDGRTFGSVVGIVHFVADESFIAGDQEPMSAIST